MFLRFVFKKIFQDYFKSFVVVFTFFLVIGFSLGLYFFYQNIEGFLIQRKLGGLQTKRFEIVKQNQGLGGLLGMGDPTGEFKNDMQKLDDLDYVDQVYKFYSSNLPVSIIVNFLGTKIQTDIFVFGVSDEIFGDKQYGDIKKLDYIPLGIAQSLMDFYNLEIANGKFFPKIGKMLLDKIGIEMFFGKSTFLNRQKHNIIQKNAKIELISPLLPMVGLTIPWSIASQLESEIENTKFNMYRVVGYVKDERNLKNIKDEFSDKYTVSFDDKYVAQIKEKLSGLRLGFVGISLIVIVLLINFMIFVLYFIILSNQRIFKVLRVHGASRLLVWKLIIYEILIYFLIASLLVIGVKVGADLVIPVIENTLYKNYLIRLDILKVSWLQIFVILCIYLGLLVGVTSLVSCKEWNKKFEN